MSETLKAAIICSLGGLISWFLIEPFYSDRVKTALGTPLFSMLFFGVAGSVLAVSISAIDGILLMSWSRARQYALEAAIIGFAWGGLGSLVGDAIWAATAGLHAESSIFRWIFRSASWTAAGAGAGFAAGVTEEMLIRIARGIAGGIVGGAVAGLVYDPIKVVFREGGTSRMVALVVLGLCVGLAIKLAEALSRPAWLVILEGKGKGKEFPLDVQEAILGTNELAQVYLWGSPDLAGRHARLVRRGNEAWLERLEGPIEVDGQRGDRLPLRDGSTFMLGSVKIGYCERGGKGVVKAVPGAAPAPVSAAPAAGRPASLPQPAPPPRPARAPVVPLRGWGALEYWVAGRSPDEPQGRLDLTVDEVLIGSDPSCTHQLVDVAAKHVLIKRSGSQVFMFDKSGGAVTQVNGQPVRGRVELLDGTQIRVGEWMMRLCLAR